MIWPFVIFALPRSRTAWLSRWLSYGGMQVGHDLGPRSDTCQGFLDKLWPLAGTVETGAQDAHHLLRHAMPDAKFVVIHRPVIDVEKSLARVEIVERPGELQRRDDVLHQIDGWHIVYDELNDVRICAKLWEHLYPAIPFDFAWWRHWDQQNVQIDVHAEMQMLVDRQQQITRLQHEIATTTASFHRIGWEPFRHVWDDPDFATLWNNHFAEARDDDRPRQPDADLLEQLERTGTLRMMTARIDGKLFGYLMWTFTIDAECIGVKIADQGIWYVDPKAPAGIGTRMLKQSISELRAAGIHSLHLHHPMHGRGARLGTLFRRLGAKETQHRYTLQISPPDAPAE